MYRKTPPSEEWPKIGLYFEGRLNQENRWVKMADRLPWSDLESDYAKHFKSCGRGEVALNVRVAMGALLIKEILGLSDRGVVEAVSENPYLQYFLGFQSFQTNPAIQRIVDDAFPQAASCGSDQPLQRKDNRTGRGGS